MNPDEQSNNTPPVNPQPTSTPPVSQPPQFTSTEPPKSNKNMLMILIAAIVIILGVVAVIMLNSNKDTNNTSNNSSSNSNSSTTSPVSDKYQKYNVTDTQSGVTFSVSFYKDAKVEEKNGRTYLNSGEAGSLYSVYLGVATGDKIDCGEASITTMRLSGESTTVCYSSDNTQYAGYAKAKSGAIKINLAGQKPISIDEAKAIMESVSFN